MNLWDYVDKRVDIELNTPSPIYGLHIIGPAIDVLPFYEEDADEDDPQTEDELLLDVSGTLISIGASKIKAITIEN